MLRQAVASQIDHDPYFTWRGDSVTRIENLSDIVFALALGMLVSASTPPTTYGELQDHLLNIIPVSAGFALMLVIWNDHFTFFRRYGLNDTTIVFLNAALLLVILFIAYPLRFIFDSMFAWIYLLLGHPARMQAMGIESYYEAGVIMAYFDAGFAVVYLLIGAMYSHALRKADMLGLSDAEQVLTRRTISITRLCVIVAVVAGLMAAFTPIGPMAGFLFWVIWPGVILIERRLKLPDPAPDPV